MKNIFDTYKIETALESDTLGNCETFSHIIGKIFHGLEFRKLIQGKKLSYYPLQWKALDSGLENVRFDSDVAISLLNSNFYVVNRETSYIKVYADSGLRSNSHEICYI